MSRVLLLSPEPVRPAMAGVGIRLWEMAGRIGARHRVTLAIPNAVEECPPQEGVTVQRYDGARLAELSRQADAVLLHGHVSNLYFAHTADRPPLVIDLYDPFPIENLNYFEELGEGTYRHDRATLERQLREGDLFLCSSEEQRLFYLGMLFALGRLNPETYFADFALGNLVRLVPFGVGAPSVESGEPVLRGVVPGIGADDPVLLFGGIYDWYDPLLLLAALPALLARFPDLRVVFSVNPNPETTPQGTYGEVVAASRERGWTGRHVFFVPWVPSALRHRLYREATAAAVLHKPRFETELSMRTRVLDYLGCGVPVVATAGGTMSRLLLERNMGCVVPPGDVAALAGALGRLLGDAEQRRELVDRGLAWAAQQGWDQVLEPLMAFLAAPQRDRHKSRYPPIESGAPPPRHSLLSRVRRRLGRR